MQENQKNFSRGALVGIALALVLEAFPLLFLGSWIRESYAREYLSRESTAGMLRTSAQNVLFGFNLQLAAPEYRTALSRISKYFDLKTFVHAARLVSSLPNEKCFSATLLGSPHTGLNLKPFDRMNDNDELSACPPLPEKIEEALAKRYERNYRQEFRKRKATTKEGEDFFVFVSDFYPHKFGHHMSTAFEAGGRCFLVEAIAYDSRSEELAFKAMRELFETRIRR